MKTTFIGIAAFALLLNGCASQTDWRPVVDPYNDPNAHRIEQDLHECRYLARQASGDVPIETTKGALVGGALGAAAGAALGAIAGNPGRGAAIGATVGGFGGGTKEGFRSENLYKRAYKKCMYNRGHQILN